MELDRSTAYVVSSEIRGGDAGPARGEGTPLSGGHAIQARSAGLRFDGPETRILGGDGTQGGAGLHLTGSGGYLPRAVELSGGRSADGTLEASVEADDESRVVVAQNGGPTLAAEATSLAIGGELAFHLRGTPGARGRLGIAHGLAGGSTRAALDGTVVFLPEVQLDASGERRLALELPLDPSFVGVTLFAQWVETEGGALSNPVLVTVAPAD